MGLDYYEILHVNRDVSDEELKRAYRKLALRWHPDKNPTKKQEAEVRFKQICEAYEVLIDPLRRSIYNEYGEEGLKGHIASSPQPGQNGRDRARYRPRSVTDIFAEFFGSKNFDFGPMWHSSSVRFPSYSGDGGGGGNTSSLGGSQQNHPIYGSFDRGVRSDGTQNNQHLKAVTVENKLFCSFEELYTGSTRKMKVSRRGCCSSQ